jgi:PIN domain nuclease of toxin-antitoxin system
MGGRSVIVLDTHVWIWWVSEPDKLVPNAKAAIDHEEHLGISPISCWEIATKVAKGRLELDRDIKVWVKQALASPRMKLLEITADIAVRAGMLGKHGFHGDPADRIIVATAISHKASLVTKDKAIRAYGKVKTIWD